MSGTNWRAFFTRRVCLGALGILIMIVLSSCDQSPMTYSIAEQYALAATRSAGKAKQLEFSFRLDPESVPTGRAISFVATFTNTTDDPIIFREPKQYGVIEALYPDTTLLFSVKPISEGISFQYPLAGYPLRIDTTLITQDEFVTLPPGSSREIVLELPHIVMIEDPYEEESSLPPGQYLVRMTYTNQAIGYEVMRNDEPRYVDLNAWVGKVGANPVVLTITSEE